MHLKTEKKLYVRIDFKIDEKDIAYQDFQDHLAYVKNIAKERYFMGGGFSNTTSGMALFEADSFEEAQEIARNDPIIKSGLYCPEIYEWNLVILSEKPKEWFLINNIT